MYQFPVLIGLILFGIVMLSFGVYVRMRYHRWKQTAIETVGTVVRIETDRPGRLVEELEASGKKGRTKGPKRVWPVFSYVDADGEQRERRSSNAMLRANVAVGDEHALFYPADRPYAARIDDGSELRVARVALAMSALCLPGMVLALMI